jgi:pyruvate ferredoxin oxidoreductase beta subunit/phenylglyoxylate dehydrogenase beta subunit
MKVMGPDTIFAIPPGCMGGVGVVGWDKKSGAKTPVFFPLLDNVASMLTGIKMHYERVGRKVNVVAFARCDGRRRYAVSFRRGRARG